MKEACEKVIQVKPSSIGECAYRLLCSQAVFLGLVALSVLTLYINQAPHNLAVTLLALFSVIYLASHFQEFILLIKKNLFFTAILIAYFLTYTFFNFYHFSRDLEGFLYAVKRSRWIFYSATLIPAAVLLFSDKITVSHKNIKMFKAIGFSFFTVILGLILWDSCSRLFQLGPSVSLFFKSSLNNGFGTRASWTYNPIPFSKITFFGCLLFGCLALNLKSFFERSLSFIFSILFLGITIATQTRASWLGVILVVPLLFFLVKKSRGLVVALLIFSAMTFYFSPSGLVVRRLQTIGAGASSFSNTYRMEHWKANALLLQDNFIIGVGYGANRKPEVISRYLVRFTKDTNLLYGHPHNEYLDVLVGVGGFSFLLFLMIILYPLKQNYTSIKKGLAFEHYNVLVFSSLYLLFLFFTALFDKITLTSWFTVLLCWGISFYYKNREV